MAWTVPVTWVPGELVTASRMNVHVRDNLNYLKTELDALSGADAAWPVGSVYTSINSTNPGTSLGFGTWSNIASGRCLVGLDAGQTEFDTVRETGGSKTHTLTTSEIPAHAHTHNSHNHTQDAHNHTTNVFSQSGGGALPALTQANNNTEITSDNTTATNQATTSTEQNAGGGGAHNNLQPYYVVYFWERTA